MIVVSGLTVLAAPWVALPSRLTHAWWSTAFRFADVTRSASALVVAALILGAAALWLRYRGLSPADVEGTSPRRLRTQALVPLVGLLFMALGVSSSLGGWWYSQSRLPVSKVSLPAGAKIESYPAIDVGGSVKRMLPHRVQVKSIDVDRGAVSLAFSTADDPESSVDQRVEVNGQVDVDGVRYSIIGVEFDARVPRVVLESGVSDTITVSATKGDQVMFQHEGTEFEVLNIVRNYLNALGPAVELESEEHGRFWIFQRAHPLGDDFDSPFDLRLRRVETGPVAVLAIGQKAGNFAVASIILFVLGLALVFGFEERLAGVGGAVSMNAASKLAEDSA